MLTLCNSLYLLHQGQNHPDQLQLAEFHSLRDQPHLDQIHLVQLHLVQILLVSVLLHQDFQPLVQVPALRDLHQDHRSQLLWDDKTTKKNLFKAYKIL